METCWNSLDSFEKVLWLIALPATLFFTIQMFATFLGMDGAAETDADFSGDLSSDIDLGGPGDTDTAGVAPFELFTLRNFINFILGLGWGGIALYPHFGEVVAVIGGAIIGVILVVLVLYMFKWLSGMTQSGNLVMSNAIGMQGSVYLRIPAEGNGHGKVHVSVQGSLRELDAITKGEALPTGISVKVTGLINTTLIVEKI
ncbi:MAG: NfeD family protein [Bacteroidia bacterium]